MYKMAQQKFIRRSQKVNFMKIAEGGFARMKFFTAMAEDKNATEYSRKYVDENFERVDVTGISSSVSFAMDERSNDDVHDVIVDIFENERLGDDATVEILSVNFSRPVDGETESLVYEAKLRSFNVIPDSEGGDAEVYSYSGTLRAQGQTKVGYAIFADAGNTESLEKCTFVTELEPEGL